MTEHLINKFFIDRLLGGLDGLLPAQQQLRLTVHWDPGNDDSTMTWSSSSGKSLRPDGQLRSRDGARLLFKWEETAAGAPFGDAVNDLRCEHLPPLCSTLPLLPIPTLCCLCSLRVAELLRIAELPGGLLDLQSRSQEPAEAAYLARLA